MKVWCVTELTDSNKCYTERIFSANIKFVRHIMIISTLHETYHKQCKNNHNLVFLNILSSLCKLLCVCKRYVEKQPNKNKRYSLFFFFPSLLTWVVPSDQSDGGIVLWVISGGQREARLRALFISSVDSVWVACWAILPTPTVDPSEPSRIWCGTLISVSGCTQYLHMLYQSLSLHPPWQYRSPGRLLDS